MTELADGEYEIAPGVIDTPGGIELKLGTVIEGKTVEPQGEPEILVKDSELQSLRLKAELYRLNKELVVLQQIGQEKVAEINRLEAQLQTLLKATPKPDYPGFPSQPMNFD